MREGTVNSTLSRGYGTLAGLGFIGAAILAIPSTRLLHPLPAAEDYLVTVAGLVTGLICMALPWERLDLRWLHAVGVVATVQAAIAVAVFGQLYTAFFFLLGIGVAYMVPDLKALFGHLTLIGVALFGPVLYGPADAESTLRVGLVVFPLLALTAGVFAYIRHRMVADQRTYRVFAEETLALAQRIAGAPLPAVERPPAAGVDLPAWSRVRVSARASGLAAVVLALPLLTAGLAAAGVKVPGFADDALGEIGMDLPNQAATAHEAGAAAPARADHGRGGAAPRGGGEGAAAGRAGDSSGRGDGDGNGGLDRSGPSTERALAGATDEVAGPPASADPGDSTSSVPSPGGGGRDGDGPLRDALEETMSGIGGLLGVSERSAPGEAPAEDPAD